MSKISNCISMFLVLCMAVLLGVVFKLAVYNINDRIRLDARAYEMTAQNGKNVKSIVSKIENDINDKYDDSVYCYFDRSYSIENFDEALVCYVIDKKANIWVRGSIWNDIDELIRTSGLSGRYSATGPAYTPVF